MTISDEHYSALLAMVRELAAAFEFYGAHRETCQAGEGAVCSCGLDILKVRFRQELGQAR